MKKIYFLLLFNSVVSFAQTQIGATINGLAANDQSGYSVSLSGNGNFVAIGSRDYNGSRGNVRVFQNNSGVWTKIGADINGLNADDQSGYSVSLSDDGTVLAIGAPYNDSNGINSGYVRVYKNTNNVWTKIGTDIKGETSDNWCGLSVSLSGNGEFLAIGAPSNKGNAVNASGRGNVRVFRNVSNVWTQVGAGINGVADWGHFAWSVSLSDDGTTVAIGSLSNLTRVYKYANNIWTQIGSDMMGEGGSDSSGTSVSLSGDGNVVAIGAPNNNGNGANAGHVRVFRNVNNSWTQIGADIDGQAGNRSGNDVSLSQDGSTVAIGAWLGGSGGLVRLFKNISNHWIQTGNDINSVGSFDNNGYSVSLSNDGSIVAVGAIRADNGNLADTGHVRIFNLPAVLKSDDIVLQKFTVSPNPTTDFVNITLQRNLILEKVNVYTALGQLIKSSTSSKISVHDLSKGNYYFEIITNKGKATKKIIVK